MNASQLANAALVFGYVLCPVHDVRVGLAPGGHVAGRCPDCAAECAKALRLLAIGSMVVS